MKVFCIDIGGTDTKYAQVEYMTVSCKGSCSTPHGETEGFLAFLEELWREHGADCQGIAISIPGLIDSDQGYIRNDSGMLRQIREVPLAWQLKRRIGIPVSVENDAKCAALAELTAGALQGCQTGALLTLGAGISGALIQNGTLYRGAHLFAGQFGYVHINLDAFDGEKGVLAVRCGGKALQKAAANQLCRRERDVDSYTIFDMAEAGDQRMLAVITDYARQIARFVYNLQCIYDPEKIVIGGGISARPLLIQAIQQEVDAIYDHDVFDLPRAAVTASRYHNDANLIGACCHFAELRGRQQQK